jgi:hypothetical protein
LNSWEICWFARVKHVPSTAAAMSENTYKCSRHPIKDHPIRTRRSIVAHIHTSLDQRVFDHSICYPGYTRVHVENELVAEGPVARPVIISMRIFPATPSGGLAILMSRNSFLYGCQDIVPRVRDTGQAVVFEAIVVRIGYSLCETLNCKEEKEDERLYFRSAYANFSMPFL